ncbi:MAG: hypothetical protein Q8R67_12270 [Rhodoferax sp.]|nr:hypothetical protein [Rhodoferax sp.]MDP3652448.1 hypothetical protein [Rhodoferax sp.]
MLYLIIVSVVWYLSTRYFRRKLVGKWTSIAAGLALGLIASMVFTLMTGSKYAAPNPVSQTSAISTQAKLMSRDSFSNLIHGKNRNDVLAAVGPPSSRQQMSGQPELWYYNGLTYDPLTNRPDSSVQVVMGTWVVERINFY